MIKINIDTLKNKNKLLVDITEKKMEGVLMRSRARWVAEGEKITKYFCGLEKRNYVSKYMNKIVTKNGQTLTKMCEIAEESKKCYKTLYEKKSQTVNYCINEMINNYLSI